MCHLVTNVVAEKTRYSHFTTRLLIKQQHAHGDLAYAQAFFIHRPSSYTMALHWRGQFWLVAFPGLLLSPVFDRLQSKTEAYVTDSRMMQRFYHVPVHSYREDRKPCSREEVGPICKTYPGWKHNYRGTRSCDTRGETPNSTAFSLKEKIVS